MSMPNDPDSLFRQEALRYYADRPEPPAPDLRMRPSTTGGILLLLIAAMIAAFVGAYSLRMEEVAKGTAVVITENGVLEVEAVLPSSQRFRVTPESVLTFMPSGQADLVSLKISYTGPFPTGSGLVVRALLPENMGAITPGLRGTATLSTGRQRVLFILWPGLGRMLGEDNRGT
jgi:hypothetical protein